MNHDFLVLIPQKNVTSSLVDFRPIAYYVVLYKIISKLHDERLKKVLPQLILENQGAFIAGRSIFNCALLALESLMYFNVQRGAPKTCIKLDVAKAYDSITGALSGGLWKACVSQTHGFRG